jgi:hypothetical protein
MGLELGSPHKINLIYILFLLSFLGKFLWDQYDLFLKLLENPTEMPYWSEVFLADSFFNSVFNFYKFNAFNFHGAI